MLVWLLLYPRGKFWPCWDLLRNICSLALGSPSNCNGSTQICVIIVDLWSSIKPEKGARIQQVPLPPKLPFSGDQSTSSPPYLRRSFVLFHSFLPPSWPLHCLTCFSRCSVSIFNRSSCLPLVAVARPQRLVLPHLWPRYSCLYCWHKQAIGLGFENVTNGLADQL